ncbi:MAG: PP2C family protein-serine/threonine phosphatase [Armatimonadota bacterium]|nr:PP2C family protein-serine/threonine phosphatase [Armatimonadota bacterium]
MSDSRHKRCPHCLTECQQNEVVCWACGRPFPRQPAGARVYLGDPSAAHRCSFHPDAPATSRCSACNRDLCARCEIPILRRIYCQKCVYLFTDLPSVFKQLHESAQKMARLAAERERNNSELRIAHDMQMSMMPKTSPSVPGLEVTGVCQPAGNVGGDYYDYFPLSDGTLGVVVGDVTGKGIPAALLMAMARSFLLAQMGLDPEPSAVLHSLGKMVASLEDRRRLMTFFYVIVDPRQRRIVYANAGHNYPYLLLPNGEQPAFLEAEGLPLGAAIQSTYTVREQPFPAGAVLVLYTDGVVEARNSAGQLYGYARFERVLSENRALPATALRSRLAQDIGGFLRNKAPDDDITLVIVRSV